MMTSVGLKGDSCAVRTAMTQSLYDMSRGMSRAFDRKYERHGRRHQRR